MLLLLLLLLSLKRGRSRLLLLLLVVLVLGRVLGLLSVALNQPVHGDPVEHLHATRGADLLALEPGLEAGGVEDVATRKLLATSDHLLPTNDAHVVHRLQLLD